MDQLAESLAAYIEYAEKTKKFSDVAFYEKVKARIAELEKGYCFEKHFFPRTHSETCTACPAPEGFGGQPLI